MSIELTSDMLIVTAAMSSVKTGLSLKNNNCQMNMYCLGKEEEDFLISIGWERSKESLMIMFELYELHKI